uniref:Uncharacterized protein n=1 Tax=Manihot esculenta TaxID=3983 RepID=A0A2C9WFU5_MANES
MYIGTTCVPLRLQLVNHKLLLNQSNMIASHVMKPWCPVI